MQQHFRIAGGLQLYSAGNELIAISFKVKKLPVKNDGIPS